MSQHTLTRLNGYSIADGNNEWTSGNHFFIALDALVLTFTRYGEHEPTGTNSWNLLLI